jgi:hypothetical protein
MNIVFTYKSDFQKGKMAEYKNAFRIIYHLKKSSGLGDSCIPKAFA